MEFRLPVHQRPNRVHWATGRIHEVLDTALAGGIHLLELGATDTADALQEIASAQARLDGLKLQLLAHAETVDVAQETAATSTAAWLTQTTRVPGGEARKLVKTAKRLPSFEASATAAIAGRIDGAQAKVIIKAVDGLPPEVGAVDRARAEAHLIELAGELDAVALKRLARHLHHVIDPDGADAALAKQLEREEARAAAKTNLVMYDDGQGSTHGRFTIPSVHGARLKVALDALMSPKRPDPIAREVPAPAVDGDESSERLVTRPLEELRGEALCELLERFPTKKLPESGGLCTVLVTIPLHVLETGLGVATLSTGATITVGAARRLACRAGIFPQVLGSKSVVLDQGRRVRLHTHPQRIAMASRDKHCTATGCTIPTSFCHAHHKQPWSRGGRTSVKDGTMLCPRHHRMVHDPRYTTEYRQDGGTCITRTRRRRT